jgi:hypothetical protein
VSRISLPPVRTLCVKSLGSPSVLILLAKCLREGDSQADAHSGRQSRAIRAALRLHWALWSGSLTTSRPVRRKFASSIEIEQELAVGPLTCSIGVTPTDSARPQWRVEGRVMAEP